MTGIAKARTADPQPVVTVIDNSLHGVTVRWHRDLDAAVHMNPVLMASYGGVKVASDIYLTSVPDAWIEAAKAAHDALRAGEDVTHLATHRSRYPGGGGPLDPIESETS